MNDPIARPAIDTVTWFGVTVPVFEYMLVGEIDELTELLQDQKTNGFRKDLECFVVIAKYRADTTLKVSKLLREPLDWEGFTRDLKRLMDPFLRAQRARIEEHLRSASALLREHEGERLPS
jgi:hypothetical protein